MDKLKYFAQRAVLLLGTASMLAVVIDGGAKRWLG
jgi:hypothetical protein